jgi:WhiB family redox-sensing transcriptional regulator
MSATQAAGVLSGDPLGWLARAACRNATADDFFPDGPVTAPAVARQVERAKRVCSCCPVRAACLAYAMETMPAHGIWGGTTEDERRRDHRRALRSRKAAA